MAVLERVYKDSELGAHTGGAWDLLWSHWVMDGSRYAYLDGQRAC